MPYVLAVDLGTTYTAAAVGRADRVEIFELGGRMATMPSLVVVSSGGGLLTGEAAERQSVFEPARTAREFKRRFGDPTPLVLGGTPYGSEALMAELLRFVIDQVTVREGGPPELTVLTHPANYGPFKLELLREVAHLADAPDAHFVPEPQAAAAHYTQQASIAEGDLVAVYDFGGGTFDAAVVRNVDGGFEVVGTPEGMERLGGMDLDEAVLDHVYRVIGDPRQRYDPNDPTATVALARLRQDCRVAKETLSEDAETTIPVMLPDLHTEVRLTRAEFEDMIRPRVRETIRSLERAAASADATFDDISRILLVGGTSRIPLIAEMVHQTTKRPVGLDSHPKHAVVLGAARSVATAGAPPPPTSPPPMPPTPSAPPTPKQEAEPRVVTTKPPRPASETAGSRRKLLMWLGAAIAGVVALAAGAAGLLRSGDETAASTTTVPSSTEASAATAPVVPTEPSDETMLAAFASDRGGPSFDLYVTDLEGSPPQRLTSDFFNAQTPVWSPGCDAIAYAASHFWIQADIFRWDTATQTTHQLTTDRSRDFHPVWSPDGTRIYFTSDRDGNNEVYAMQRDGSGAERITNHEADDRVSDVSPDGRQIAIWSNRDGDFDIYLMDTDGGNTTRLTDDPAWDAQAVWSPDGTRLAFWSRRSGDNEIYVMASDGSNVRQLTFAPGDDRRPRWSADGEQLVFRSDRGDDQEVWLMNADGSNQTNLTQSPGDDRGPSLCKAADGLSDLPAPPVAEVFEAETGTVQDPMAVLEDADASGGRYVATSRKEEGSVSYDVDVTGGLYVVWARVAAGQPLPTSADSFFVSVDGGKPDVWDFFEERTDPSTAWGWEMISLRCGGDEIHNCDPWTIELAPGVHTLTFGGRDPGSRLDAIFLTTDPRAMPAS